MNVEELKLKIHWISFWVLVLINELEQVPRQMWLILHKKGKGLFNKTIWWYKNLDDNNLLPTFKKHS
jgi:hypothetical protein